MLAHPLPTTDFPHRCAQALRERGFVLPVVLVMLVVMSTVVLLMIRRGTVDERLAANVASVVTMDTGVNYALRTCERLIRTTISADPADKPNVRPALPATSATPLWRNPAEWTANAVVLPSDFYGPGVNAARCLIETADDELVGGEKGSDPLTKTPGNQLDIEHEFAKFRITAEASGPGRDGGDRLARSQSEMRIRTN